MDHQQHRLNACISIILIIASAYFSAMLICTNPAIVAATAVVSSLRSFILCAMWTCSMTNPFGRAPLTREAKGITALSRVDRSTTLVHITI